jgi:hypothetical protein
MLKLGSAVLFAVTLAGCVEGGADSGPHLASVYQCVPSDETSGGEKNHRLTVSYDGHRTLLSFDGGSVNYLDPVPDVKDQLFANSKYAWKVTGAGGALTDIAAVRVFSCAQTGSTSSVAQGT